MNYINTLGWFEPDSGIHIGIRFETNGVGEFPYNSTIWIQLNIMAHVDSRVPQSVECLLLDNDPIREQNIYAKTIELM